MVPFREVVGGGCRKRDSASSKLKLKKQASLSLAPFQHFFPPSFLWDSFVFYWCAFPFLAFCCCLPSEIFTSLPNGNVALPTSCVGTTVSGLGYLLHSLPSSRRGDEKSDSSSKAWKRGVQVYWLRGILCILQPKAQKKIITAPAASGGDGAGGGVQVTFQREIAHQWLMGFSVAGWW